MHFKVPRWNYLTILCRLAHNGACIQAVEVLRTLEKALLCPPVELRLLQADVCSG